MALPPELVFLEDLLRKLQAGQYREGISELYRALEKPDVVGRSPLLPIQLFDTVSQLVNMVGPNNYMFVAAAAGLLLERLRKFIKDTRMLDDVAEVLTEANTRHRYLRTRISLGKGAYADVFLGFDMNNDMRQVAIKRIDWKKQLAINGPKIEEVLNREIATMQKLDQRNIVRLYDTLRVPGFVYLMLEFCAGGTLGDLIKTGPLPEERARLILSDLAEAFRFLRSHQMLHRDLKPENILFLEVQKRTTKLADFTFARITEPGKLLVSFVGSPLYMGPEIFLSKPGYTEKADLWSIGVILYEMLTGRRPVEAADMGALTEQHRLKLDPVIPPALARQLSAPCVDLMQQLLKKDPTFRISWPEFFAHPFVRPPAPIAPVPAPSPGLANSGVQELRLQQAELRSQQAEARAAKAEAENAELKKQLKLLEARLSELQAATGNAQRDHLLRVRELESKASSLEAALLVAQTKAADEMAMRLAAQRKEEVEEYARKLRLFEEASQRQSAAIQQAEGEYRRKEAEFQTSLEQSVSKVASLTAELTNLNRTVQALHEAIREKKSEIHALHSEKEEAIADYQRQLTLATQKIQNLEYILQLQEQNNREIGEFQLIGDKPASERAKDGQEDERVRELRRQLEGALDQNKDLAEQKRRLESTLRDTTAQLDQSKAAIDDLTKREERAKRDLERMQNELTAHETLVRDLLPR
jgi:serine/threonine-protein kinase ULK/ATG1